jgi:hypothetical protein
MINLFIFYFFPSFFVYLWGSSFYYWVFRLAMVMVSFGFSFTTLRIIHASSMARRKLRKNRVRNRLRISERTASFSSTWVFHLRRYLKYVLLHLVSCLFFLMHRVIWLRLCTPTSSKSCYHSCLQSILPPSSFSSSFFPRYRAALIILFLIIWLFSMRISIADVVLTHIYEYVIAENKQNDVLVWLLYDRFID